MQSKKDVVFSTLKKQKKRKSLNMIVSIILDDSMNDITEFTGNSSDSS